MAMSYLLGPKAHYRRALNSGDFNAGEFSIALPIKSFRLFLVRRPTRVSH
jgi:hypothetical protein